VTLVPKPILPLSYYRYKPLYVNRIKRLILNYLRNEITDAERRELDEWLAESTDNQLLFDQINDPVQVGEALSKMDAMHEEEIWARISVPTPAGRPGIRRILRYGSVAAAVLFLTAGIYFWRQFQTERKLPVARTASPHDVPPGRNRAILTLSNGAQIVLDSAHAGDLAQQGTSRVLKTDSGQITYNAINEKPTAILYNTLTTPRGGQYQLTLPDGTRVWLNAASSITYPTAFTGAERKVVMTGEAYFEVTENASRPFKVVIGDKEEIDVLGTNFNANGYEDEREMKTTLLDGSVRVNSLVGVNTNKTKLSVVLKPGQQAQLGTSLKVKDDADIEEAVAWKNGKFIFTGNDIASVMRQIGRWYNVEIKYKGDFEGVELVGVISRNKNVSEILRMLEQTRAVKFTVEGRAITVFPYKN
jgi:transmembrane sensor